MRGLVTCLVLTGCFAPTPPEGAPCTTSQECPDPLTCSDGHCRRDPVPGDATDAVVDSFLGIDANPGCRCTDSSTIMCNTDPAMTCPLGCVAERDGARCGVLVPSNGVPLDGDGLTTLIQIDGTTTFDTNTGEITGGLTRAAGEGVLADIRFTRLGPTTGGLGVFTFHRLFVTPTGVVHFTGAPGAVFVVATNATIAGAIDGSGGCYGAARSCAGPGGGAGAPFGVMAGGCGAGVEGESDPGVNGSDAGGGGGAGGLGGGKGGDSATFVGGAAGTACIAASAVPLVGGSGGGGGGARMSGPPGGGGGGAFQLTAVDQITVSGTITMGGEGGSGGTTPLLGNATAGSGGGAGGAILLESTAVMLAGTAKLAANGGGGGGGGQLGTPGGSGEHAKTSTAPATGGSGAGNGGDGGDGGAAVVPAGAGAMVVSPYNAGGGGGGVGRIYIRAQAPMLGGSVSPPAGTGTLTVQ